ncbi:site-specific integrase [uncultured Anaerotruncus sp.]|uniref:tyrosine-type recombinase/integrase n=1 Tax=uncultured Anaerotruncus sp. TaxID=905011 RepID=UPI00280BD196|nr:site-specific integrase [uncultured Anaerotruncus sp.]
MLNKGIYLNLLSQFDKLSSHNRQGSYKTKARYAEAFKRFLAYLAEEYRLEKLANIAPKHLFSYVDHLSEKGLSAAYIKTELSAIRFFHDQIAGAKYTLPNNAVLDLKRRRFGGVDRTWGSPEFNRFLARASKLDHNDYIAILCLGRYAALRIHECFRLDTAAAEKALTVGMLTVKGKGGLVREVPINDSIRIMLRDILKVTPRGQKLFVAPDDKTHLAIHRLEAFINYHKAEMQEVGSTRPMTFHGLRHTCAAEWYDGFIRQGFTELEARKKVSKLLGHTRDDVTRIYLASRFNGGSEGD